jgi:hypothetical protein
MNIYGSLLISAMLGMLVASPAGAAEWWYVTSSRDETAHFVDASSIQIDNNSVKYWSLVINTTPINGVKSTKTRWSKSCLRNTLSLIQWADYDEDGMVSLTSEGQFSGQISSIAPETIAEDKHRFICAKSTERAKFGIKLSVTPEIFAYRLQKLGAPPE